MYFCKIHYCKESNLKSPINWIFADARNPVKTVDCKFTIIYSNLFCEKDRFLFFYSVYVFWKYTVDRFWDTFSTIPFFYATFTATEKLPYYINTEKGQTQNSLVQKLIHFSKHRVSEITLQTPRFFHFLKYTVDWIFGYPKSVRIYSSSP